MLVFCCLFIAFCVGNIILKPTGNKVGLEYGLILLPDKGVKPELYVNISESLQDVFQHPLYIGIVSWTELIPNEIEMDLLLLDIIAELEIEGMYVKADIFIAGHGHGGYELQKWTGNHKYNTSALLSHKYKGQILMGSFIARNFRDNNTMLVNKNYSIPTITFGGELDGVCRVSRIIEQFHVQLQMPNNNWDDNVNAVILKENIINYPVFVMKGLSHMSFAYSNDINDIPKNILEYDLKPEMSYTDGYASVNTILNAWINVQISYNETDYNILVTSINNTKSFASPFIDALILEGFYYFKLPCNCDPLICNSTAYCQGGSIWSSTPPYSPQYIMSGINEIPNVKIGLTVTDSYHPTYQTNPIHYANIYNNCSSPYDPSCTLLMSTVTQNMYEWELRAQSEFNFVDTGFYTTSAIKVRNKMKSRYAVYKAINYNINYNETFDYMCANILQVSYQYGLSHVPPQTLQRYNEYGQHLSFGLDINAGAGPAWTYAPINHTQLCNESTHHYYISIRSHYLYTPDPCYFTDYECGDHYCQGLSPAYMMEWIYIDSLRFNFSLLSNPNNITC